MSFSGGARAPRRTESRESRPTGIDHSTRPCALVHPGAGVGGKAARMGREGRWGASGRLPGTKAERPALRSEDGAFAGDRVVVADYSELFSSFAGRNPTVFDALMVISWPVWGLRP